ncbi:MAG: DoxX family protein [Gemmatimonadales bacterium]|nr:DoxX family protein [Gemmatimonadales bacterium]
MALSAAQSLSLIRRIVAATLLIHGAARIAHSGVSPFGEFLAGQGIPFGFALAWAISIFEVIGGIALWLGRFVRPVAWLFAGQLAAGVALVHAREGWFVVGLGRNGMEFSVLLIGCLVALALAHGPARK